MDPPIKNNTTHALKRIAEALHKAQKDLWVLAEKIENQMPGKREIQAPPSFSDQKWDLSNTERKLLRHLSHGFSNDEIAEKLQLSPHTVATYRKRILKKLNLKNTAQLVRFTIENQLG